MNTAPAQPKRVQALDVTRGIAVFGMIYMNFKISVLQDYVEGYSFLSSQEGRFGALFIFLAGMGISLMNRKAAADTELLVGNRRKLVKRALYLLVLGMLFSLYWQADIFHFYAFYIFISIPLIRFSGRTLFRLAFFPPLVFLLLFLLGNWEAGWNWETMQYTDFYSLPGFFRNLVFNGFHPVFPWISFLFLGMSMGKADLTNQRMQIRHGVVSAIVLVAAEGISTMTAGSLENFEWAIFLSTRAMPPMPLFVISAGAQNILILSIVLLFTGKTASGSRIMNSLSETGKMVMTHYIVHLFLGLLPLLLLQKYVQISGGFVLFYSLGYFILTIRLTAVWRKRFAHGPFEMLMRKISG